MVGDVIKGLLGGGIAQGVKDVAEVFRPNAEAVDRRDAEARAAALSQMAAEFDQRKRGWFDRLIDGVNRLPRPAMALGVLALFVAAMVDPLWFAERMQGLALVPEPLWWLLGAVVSFYFGARHQVKGQEFQRSIAATMARAPRVMQNISAIRELRHDDPGAAMGGDVEEPADNPVLTDWLKRRK